MALCQRAFPKQEKTYNVHNYQQNKDIIKVAHSENTLAPSIVGASLKVFDIIKKDNLLIKKLHDNTSYFRKKMKEVGFDIVDGTHPIVPIMLYDAVIAKNMSNSLLERGIYVVGFYFPVVPKDKARIRVQLSAGHSKEQLDKAIHAFREVGKDLKII